MEKLEGHFRVVLKDRNMQAYIECKNPQQLDEDQYEATLEDWQAFLAKHKVTFGIQATNLHTLAENPKTVQYPILVAQGLEPVTGADGKIEYMIEFEQEVNRDENWDFREVMNIPSVNKGDKLATIMEPTVGEDGINVLHATVKAQPGRPAVFRPGKNVEYRENTMSFYAEETGQFSVVGKRLQVQPEFEINESVSMKSGNLDFVGTIVIRGDVPTGFTVKAEGDVKIYGLVEAATIIAGGSIIIAEGINGQGKGVLQAGEDIKIGYINQAKVTAENDLYVENSILHSECAVYGHVYCQRGNIIGGSVSAGKTIEAHDIGTRYSAKTDIVFGVNKSVMDKEIKLIAQKKELVDTLHKLQLLGEKLQQQDSDHPKIRISMLRQKNSLQKTEKKLNEVNDELADLNSSIGEIGKSKLTVRNFIYQNVNVSFGKYQLSLKHDYHYIQMSLEGSEVAIHQLYQ